MVMVVVVGTRELAGAENTSDFGRISHELGHASDVVEKAMMMFKTKVRSKYSLQVSVQVSVSQMHRHEDHCEGVQEILMCTSREHRGTRTTVGTERKQV